MMPNMAKEGSPPRQMRKAKIGSQDPMSNEL